MPASNFLLRALREKLRTDGRFFLEPRKVRVTVHLSELFFVLYFVAGW